jgi:hypothetical protein
MPCTNFESFVCDLSGEFTRGRDDQCTDVGFSESAVVHALLSCIGGRSVGVGKGLESGKGVQPSFNRRDKESLEQ